MESKITFYGAAGSVTGSHFLLEVDSPSASLGATKIRILVDCGLRQGMGEEHNWDDFPYDPKDIGRLFVTHAHLDHIGRIPKLVKDGFVGEIISTKATKVLAEPMLYDAMEILRHHSERLGKKELYGKEDIQKALSLWRGVDYHKEIEAGSVVVKFFDAGHILGSAMIRFERDGRAVAFTGDLGGGNSPLLSPTEELPSVQYLVMEGTYGDRTRPQDKERRERLEDDVEDAAARGGSLIIPAFSTERTQDLLFDIRALMEERRVPLLPVYLDSPLAEKITDAYLRYPEYFAPDIRKRIDSGEKIFSFPQLRFVATPEESHALDANSEQKIILAGSGMSSGGRVFGHEKKYLPDPKSTLLIVGYQAVGTIGRQLIEGTKSITVRPRRAGSGAEKIPVRAHIEELYGYSAHSDGEELLEFANKASAKGCKEIFIVHGEPASTMFLAQRIRDYLGTKAIAPEAGQSATIQF